VNRLLAEIPICGLKQSHGKIVGKENPRLTLQPELLAVILKDAHDHAFDGSAELGIRDPLLSAPPGIEAERSALEPENLDSLLCRRICGDNIAILRREPRDAAMQLMVITDPHAVGFQLKPLAARLRSAKDQEQSWQQSR
jgi:hypothetical protein